MEQVQHMEDEKLGVMLTEENLRAIYSSATNLPSPHLLGPSSFVVYEGMLTKVSLLSLSNQELPGFAPVHAIVKRYLPPEEQTLTFAGRAYVPPLDGPEFKHLTLFHTINSKIPEPYYHDPSQHIIAMEALDGSFHDLLGAYYSRFEKANQVDRERIRTRVRQDLETILDQTSETFQAVNRAVRDGSKDYTVFRLDRDILMARHDRGMAAIVNLGLHLDLSEIMDSPAPEVATFRRITHGTIARESGVFFNRFNNAKERSILFSYLQLQEAVSHGDLLPGNVLYRRDKTGKPSDFVPCDLGNLYSTPFDFDLITLLNIDPRIKLMLSLPERKEIYDSYFSKFSANALLQNPSSSLSRDKRFALGSVASLLRYIGAIYFYLDQKDPEASVRAQGDLSLLEKIDPHLPFKPDRYFGIQYASLLELLNIEPARTMLPDLARGVSHYFSPQTQKELKQLLQQDTRTVYQKITSKLRRSFKWLNRIAGPANLSTAFF